MKDEGTAKAMSHARQFLSFSDMLRLHSHCGKGAYEKVR
jgi:hypothetical protein